MAAKTGLTPQRYDVLLMVKSADPAAGIRLTELCGLLQMGQTAVTDLVKRMEKAGLLERRGSSEDRRVALLGLTAEGEARLRRTSRLCGTTGQRSLRCSPDLTHGSTTAASNG